MILPWPRALVGNHLLSTYHTWRVFAKNLGARNPRSSGTLAQKPRITMKSETRLAFIGGIIDQRSRETEGPGCAARQLLEGAKKEALDNAEKAGLLTSSKARGLPCRKRRDPCAS